MTSSLGPGGPFGSGLLWSLHNVFVPLPDCVWNWAAHEQRFQGPFCQAGAPRRTFRNGPLLIRNGLFGPTAYKCMFETYFVMLAPNFLTLISGVLDGKRIVRVEELNPKRSKSGWGAGFCIAGWELLDSTPQAGRRVA